MFYIYKPKAAAIKEVLTEAETVSYRLSPQALLFLHHLNWPTHQNALVECGSLGGAGWAALLTGR